MFVYVYNYMDLFTYIGHVQVGASRPNVCSY